jgi:hypothetical protein
MEDDKEYCEICGEEAVYLIERRVVITNLKTEVARVFPDGPYEVGLMTDVVCAECANDEGFQDDELPRA